MMRFGRGGFVVGGVFGLAGGVSPTGPALPTSTFDMTQLAAPNRVYQRATATGGGQGKGTGTIPVTISSATAGTINARCRSAADGVTILQAEWLAATVTGGATTANIAGVDARTGWFFLDLKGADGAWKLGTVAVGMGAVMMGAGQSRMLGMMANSTAAPRMSDLGMTPNPNAAIFHSTTAGGAVNWVLLGNNSSAGGSEVLDQMVAMTGVNCAFGGYAVGSSAISTWQPGQANHTELARVIGLAGGAFEKFWWYQAHANANLGTNYQTYFDGLTTVMADIAARSSVVVKHYVSGMTNWATGASGAGFGYYYQINRAQKDWCDLNGGTHMTWHDLTMGADNLHPVAYGNRQTGWHVARAMRPEHVPGAQGDEGPVVTSVTRSGANIVMDLALKPGTALALRGNPLNRIQVTRPGDNAGTILATSSITQTGPAQLTLAMAADPGDRSLQINMWTANPNIDGTVDGIFDDYTADGIPTGRLLKFTTDGYYMKPAATTASVAGVTFAAGAPFGQGRSNGKMATTTWPIEGRFVVSGWTLEVRAKFVTVPTVRKMLFGAGFGVGVVADGGGIEAMGVNIPYALVAGVDYHFRLVIDNMSRDWRLFVNGVLVHQVADLATVPTLGGSAWGIGGWPSTSTVDMGNEALISDMAIWRRPLNRKGETTCVVPTAAYVGNEPGLKHYWRCNGDGADSAVAGGA